MTGELWCTWGKFRIVVHVRWSVLGKGETGHQHSEGRYGFHDFCPRLEAHNISVQCDNIDFRVLIIAICFLVLTVSSV